MAEALIAMKPIHVAKALFAEANRTVRMKKQNVEEKRERFREGWLGVSICLYFEIGKFTIGKNFPMEGLMNNYNNLSICVIRTSIYRT